MHRISCYTKIHWKIRRLKKERIQGHHCHSKKVHRKSFTNQFIYFFQTQLTLLFLPELKPNSKTTLEFFSVGGEN